MCFLRCAACFSGLTCVAYPPQRIHCWNPVSGTNLLEASIWRDLGALKAHQKPVNRLLNYFLPCVMKDLRVAYTWYMLTIMLTRGLHGIRPRSRHSSRQKHVDPVHLSNVTNFIINRIPMRVGFTRQLFGSTRQVNRKQNLVPAIHAKAPGKICVQLSFHCCFVTVFRATLVIAFPRTRTA